MTHPPETGPEEILRVEAVRVVLSGRLILDDVSFTCLGGEFVGLIGSNGAGKTTLMRVILGLVRPAAGRILVAGEPRSRRNPLIGYVPQKINLDPDVPMRARDLVGLGLDGHRFGPPWPSAKRAARVDEMIEAVDATGFADSRVGSLSGGEQQRIMIAHALISRPRLLLLDEPLANLDISSEREVVKLVASIAARHKVAVVVSTHDMNPLLTVMSRVVYVAAGRVASGTTDEVVTTRTLSRLYGHDVDVIDVNGRVLVVAGRENEGLHHHEYDNGKPPP